MGQEKMSIGDNPRGCAHRVPLMTQEMTTKARKRVCSYGAARYRTTTTGCVLGIWMPTTQASTDQGASVYLTGFLGERWQSGVFPSAIGLPAQRPLWYPIATGGDQSDDSF